MGRDLVYSSTKIRKELVPDYDKDVMGKRSVYQKRGISSQGDRLSINAQGNNMIGRSKSAMLDSNFACIAHLFCKFAKIDDTWPPCLAHWY